MPVGRKFIVAMSGLGTSFVLALLNKLTGEYTTVVSVVVGAFHAADTLITRKSLDAK